MRYYFAPLEGLTDSVYRRVHHKYFPGVDRYYTPFLSPTVHRALTAREMRELPKADSVPFSVVPQILTKVPEDFLWLTQQCRELGYEEVNLNTGCPSGTVTAKGKGSGMLRELDALDAFLEEVFTKTVLPVSVKTRIGFYEAEEFPAILDIFNRYPIRELTVHPRVRKDFYASKVNMDAFRYAVENSRNPLCYNGNLTSLKQIEAFSGVFPKFYGVLLGRVLIGDPGLLGGGTDAATLEAFCDELFAEYTVVFGSARNAMFRLKDNWHLLACRFENAEKLTKRLRKATDAGEFTAISHEIFRNCPMREELNPDW